MHADAQSCAPSAFDAPLALEFFGVDLAPGVASVQNLPRARLACDAVVAVVLNLPKGTQQRW